MPKPADAKRSSERMDFRVDPEYKELIERAAAYSGVTLSGFAVSTLVNEARRIIREHEVSMLTDRDRDRFLAMLEKPAAPTSSLRRAVQRHGRIVTRAR